MLDVLAIEQTFQCNFDYHDALKYMVCQFSMCFEWAVDLFKEKIMIIFRLYSYHQAAIREFAKTAFMFSDRFELYKASFRQEPESVGPSARPSWVCSFLKLL